MPLTLGDIDARVRVEGKDSNNQFPVQRADFIRDTCIEISTTQQYYWLKEVKTLTVPTPNTDWFNLPNDFHMAEQIAYLNQNFTYLSEDDFFRNYSAVSNDTAGYFRVRYNATSGVFQLALINPPPAGSSLTVLEKKYYESPEFFPPYMEECIVQGAVSRFLTFLEGDDLELAGVKRKGFEMLAAQQDKMGNNKLAGTPRRTKTPKELIQEQQNNQYRSQ